MHPPSPAAHCNKCPLVTPRHRRWNGGNVL